MHTFCRHNSTIYTHARTRAHTYRYIEREKKQFDISILSVKESAPEDRPCSTSQTHAEDGPA